MGITTAWVKPPPQISGLDHLAVQAPCISIYGRLLPGITNVTDRARYYSFYPWLIWSFDQQGFTKFGDEFKERFRRADCLFSLIAERHAYHAGGEYEDHAGAMVGSNTLAPVAKALSGSSKLKLSDYSLREGAKARYFKNPLGGLGQYYLGVLRELGIVDGDTAAGVKYTRQIGQVIAERMDAGFDSELFLSAVEADEISTGQLDALSTLCPCQLHNNPGEKEILTELFFARNLFHDIEALPRRRTLQSILQLATLLAYEDTDVSEATFRACAYSGGLPSGRHWETPRSLIQNRAKWSIYARNELLSVAIQGLFFALLDAYEESRFRFDASAQLVEWFVHEPETLSALEEIGTDSHFSQLMSSAATNLPPLTQWKDPSHEVQFAEQIVKLSRQDKSADNRRLIIVAALRVVIALAQRPSGEHNAYGDLVFEDGYFRYYPINLRSFSYHTKNTWSSLETRDYLRWLLLHWGIDTHLRVALRKLRGQSQSTFRIRPADNGLEVIGIPQAVHTRPRFNQAVRVLKDIGALSRTESGVWIPSELGTEMLEFGDAP